MSEAVPKPFIKGKNNLWYPRLVFLKPSYMRMNVFIRVLKTQGVFWVKRKLLCF
jgi:hypothetical protein